MQKFYFKIVNFIVACVALGTHCFAQSCNSCSLAATTSGTSAINVLHRDTNSYSISSGQVLCIFPSGRFTGKLTINGGLVCNKGTFNPSELTFNGGGIDNFRNARLPPMVVNSGKTLTNHENAALAISGNMTVSGGAVFNEGVINISGSLVNTSGTMTNKAIVNCSTFTGTNTVVNPTKGVINTR